MPRKKPETKLTLPLDRAYLPLVMSFAEQSAQAFGLSRDDALSLTLATEEVFNYMATHSRGPESIRVSALNGIYYGSIRFRFFARDLDLRSLNLTATAKPEVQPDLESLGLLIASRTLDRLRLQDMGGKGLALVLVKERTYPKAQAVACETMEPADKFSITGPDGEQVKALSHLVTNCYPPQFQHPALMVPGKLVDMIESQEYGAAVAVNPKGELLGGCVWHYGDAKLVQLLGPFTPGQPIEGGIPQALAEACLQAIAKTEYAGLFCRCPTPEFPVSHFEDLGVMKLTLKNQGEYDFPCYFRQTKEDPGESVWVHPLITEYLEEQYDRLFLARRLMQAEDAGEAKSAHSVLGSEVERGLNQVILRPFLDGADFPHNLAQHIKVMRGEGIGNILFVMDLDQAWHARLTPTLIELGFEPALLLPFGGQADLLYFQHHGA